MLKEIISGNDFLEQHEFKGIAIDDEWVGKYAKGPIEWFLRPPMHTTTSRNPFDLLSICLMVELV